MSKPDFQTNVLRQSLAAALAAASKAVNAKSTLPVLQNFLIRASGNTLSVTATNLEQMIAATVTAQNRGEIEEWEITIPAKTLLELVATLPDGVMVELTPKPKTQSMLVRAETSKTEIKGMAAQEFPPTPRMVGSISEFDLDAEVFGKALNRVIFSASTDEGRPVLTGVHMFSDGSKLTLETADGFRLTRISWLPEQTMKPFSANIPARALKPLVAALKDAAAVTVSVSERMVKFDVPGWALYAQTLEGAYPDLTQVIGKNWSTLTKVSLGHLANAAKRAKVLAGDLALVKLDVTPALTADAVGQIITQAQTEELGQTETTLDAIVAGPAVKIGLNVKFLAEALAAAASPTIQISLNKETDPAKIECIGDDTFLHVIMPMHLK